MAVRSALLPRAANSQSVKRIVKTFDSIVRKRLLPLLAGLLILRVTIVVVLNYRNYLPPDFESDFLQDREQYFWKGYHWAFYAHLVSGPLSLILGMILISDRFRTRFPNWHRYLGRLQAINVLFLVAPSGLLMAYYAMTGPIAAMGFAVLAIVGNIVTSWSWFGANELGVGLHSYGFTEGVWALLWGFWISQIASVAVGIAANRFWPKLAVGNATSDAASAAGAST